MIFFFFAFLFTACEDKTMTWDGDTIPAEECAYPLVQLQTGSDDSCAGGSMHYWPITMAPSDCHGWAAIDHNGEEHYNSADNITCHADGSFSFVQYANTIDCSGSGVTKTYYPDVCEQDTPPSLYTLAVDLSCCEDPLTCTADVPSVEQEGSFITLNNALCE